MGSTPNWDIYYLENSDPGSQVTESSIQAGTIEAALDGISGNIDSVNNFGVQYFVNASARDLALTNPEVGWLTQLGSELFMRRWDGTAWRPYGSGLFPIRPSSVSGSGASIDPNGWVEMSSTSSFSVNGVFSSEFRDYEIRWETTSFSPAAALRIRLRSGGTDATANYANHYSQGAGSTMVVGTSSIVDSFMTAVSSHVRGSGITNLYSPAVSGPTHVRTVFSGFDGSLEGISNGQQTDNTTYDGMTVFYPGSTFSGRIRIFGVI